MAGLCWGCASDAGLCQRIKKIGEVGKCMECASTRNKVLELGELATLIANVIGAHFQLGEEQRVYDGIDDDRGYFIQSGDELDEVIQEITGQYFSFQDELVDAVVDTDEYWPPDGEEPFLSRDYCYVPTPVSLSDYYGRWEGLREELRVRRRYFSKEAADLFADVFTDVESLMAGEVPVIKLLPEGSLVYRGRVCDSDELASEVVGRPFEKVGPPPPGVARAGRMNPEGISVLYCAEDRETCVAELRPSIGSRVAVISLRTNKALRLLDFCALEKSRRPGGLSYFQDDFEQAVRQSAFTRAIHRLISSPVVPGRESDYLVTQVMAEYLAHVHPDGFDGVIFSSVQRRGGVNVVLFFRENFPVQYEERSLNFYSVGSVSYEFAQQHIFEKKDGSILFHGYDYDESDW